MSINWQKKVGNLEMSIYWRKKTGELKKFDELKFEHAIYVDKISIDSSSVDVNIFCSDSSDIEAHFYGKANLDGTIEFDVQLVERELKITLNILGECYNNKLYLDVRVPKKRFKEISVKTESADVQLNQFVLTEHLSLTSKSGDLDTEAIFTSANITTTTGNIDFYIDAENDITANLSTTEGDVTLDLNNLGTVNLSITSEGGDVSNHGTYEEDGYTAQISIFTISGDVDIW